MTTDNNSIDSKHRRAFLIQDHILLVHELQQISVQETNHLFDEIERIAQPYDKFGVICVFPDNAILGADERAAVFKRFSALKPRVVHLALVTKANPMLKVSIKFMSVLTRFWHYSIHGSIDDALVRMRKELKESVMSESKSSLT